MSVRLLLEVLRAHWRPALMVTLGVWALSLASVLLSPPRYMASASLLIDTRSDPLGVAPLAAAPLLLANQIEVLRSRRVAEKVVRRPDLAQSLWPAEAGARSAQTRDDALAARADWLLRQLQVRPLGGGSQAVEVQVQAAEAQLAAQLADAVVQGYLEVAAEMRVEPARAASRFFAEQTEQARLAVQAAQSRLAEHQQRHGLVLTDDRLDLETQRLALLDEQLVRLQSDATRSAVLSEQAGRVEAMAAGGADSPEQAAARAELARAEAQRDAVQARLGAQHPQWQQARQAVEAAQSRLAAERQRLGATLSAGARSDAERAARLQASLAQQRQQVLRLQQQRDQATLLQQDLDAARRNHDQLRARLESSRLDSLDQPGAAAWLARAAVPSRPASPRLAVHLLLGACLGLALGLAVAWALELSDPRLRTPDQVQALTPAPLLGRLPEPDLTAADALVMRAAPHSPQAQAVRTLRSRLLALGATSHGQAGPWVMLGAGAGDECSRACANLGLALAQAGARVLLVDADLRGAALSRWFEGDPGSRAAAAPIDTTRATPGACGLAAALCAPRPEAAAAALEPQPVTGVEGLWWLPAGWAPAHDALDLLDRPTLAQLLQPLGERFDHLLIHTPPAERWPDALVLAQAFRRPLLVLRPGGSRLLSLRDLLAGLSQRELRPLGWVLSGG